MSPYKYAVFLAFLCVSCRTADISSDNISGTYIGLESIGTKYDDITPNDTTDRWYHENTLAIRGDSVFLEKVPVVFTHRHHKAYSASDGGFYSYRGELSKDSVTIVAHLLLTQHDYVLIPYRLKNPADSSLQISEDEKFKQGLYVVDSSFFKQTYPLEIREKTIIMNGNTYKRKAL